MPTPVLTRRLKTGQMGVRAPGTPGQAAHFANASSQSLTAASNSSLQLAGTDFAFTCWLNLTDLPTYRIIVSKESGGTQAAMEYEIRVNSGGNLETVWSNGSNFFVTTGPAVSTGAWHWLYVESNSGTGAVTRIVDTTSATDTAAGQPQASTGTFGLGWDGRATNLFMNGNLDAAALWKRRLTTAERSLLYNNGAGIRISRHPELWASLVSGWELDDSGATWFDWFASNHLTNNNGVTSVAGIS